ncbi:MAG: hypothetical protein ACRETL_06075, partial [Gammaproteobacteria bacterium]
FGPCRIVEPLWLQTSRPSASRVPLRQGRNLQKLCQQFQAVFFPRFDATQKAIWPLQRKLSSKR